MSAASPSTAETTQSPDKSGLAEFAAGPVAAIAAVTAVVLTALSGRYGFHRDELYFLQAGQHLDWGYVDQPPLTPALSRLSVALFGESPTGLRVVSTLACAAMIIVVALIARELGGDRRAQLLAACCAAVSGYVLAIGHMVSTSTFDTLAWLLIGWVSMRLLRTGDGRWWAVAGLLVGVAVLNKYLVVLLVAALPAAVAITGPRRVLRTRWLPIGVFVAVIVAAPNLWWQAANDWPQWTVAEGISEEAGAENRIMFVPEQLMQLSPLLVPVWLAGWWRLWRDTAVRWARPVAVAYPLLCGLVVAIGGKGYYALPLLMVLLAAGCQPTLDWLRRGRAAVRRWQLGAALSLAAVTSASITLPILPASALSIVNSVNQEQGEQVGWDTLAAGTADAWRSIPAADRDRSVIFTQNYGQAGAIAHYAPEYGMPDPYSGHMSHADWGPPPDAADGPVVLVHWADNSRLLGYFTDCREHGRVDNGHDVDNEDQDAVISVCSGATARWSALWPSLRHYY